MRWLWHEKQIIALEQIYRDHIQAYCGDWRYVPEKNKGDGAQIDLIFDRDDDCITLCEIKHTDKPFVITKDYAAELARKASIYEEKTRTKKQLIWCLVSSNGVSKNDYFEKMISNVVCLNNFFD